MKLLFYILATGCSFLEASSGFIESPNYPNYYANHQDKTYNIEVENGKKIEITFESFDLEFQRYCNWDWMKVVDIGQGETLLEKSCGNNIPAKIMSTSNKVDVIFHSDYSVTRKGFKLSWRALDMTLDGSYACLTPPHNPKSVRGAQKDGIDLWDGGVVPYEMTSSFQDSDKKTFLKAIQEIEEETCLRFKPRKDESAYIKAARECDCTSGTCFGGAWVSGGLGKQSPSGLYIGKTCLSPDSRSSVALVIHEILHSLGVVHTQTRPDRNDYIVVNESNIQNTATARYQYEICQACLTYNTPYNCMSVMHYKDYFFSNGNGPTMVKKESNAASCDLHTYMTKLENSDIELLNKMYQCESVWKPIMDCYTKLALTADSSQTGSGLSTKSLTGADNQLWMMDSEGRVVNKQSGLVIDGNAGRPYLQQSTPLTSSKQWKIRSDIRSNQETGSVNVPKLVENGRQNCLNTANRFQTQGSVVIMYSAAYIHPDNACWETTFLVWKPILDCFTGLALTTLGSGEGSALSTKPLSGKDNQMWAFDSKKRIVNKESGLVIDGRGGTQFMKQPTPLTGSKQWHLRTDIRSYQETDTATVQKLVENSREDCLNTQNRFSSGGSTIIMYSAAHVHPDNACWKF